MVVGKLGPFSVEASLCGTLRDTDLDMGRFLSEARLPFSSRIPQIPNAMGVLLGTAQLVLYACYCKERPAAVADTESGGGGSSTRGGPVLHKNLSDVQLLSRTLSIGEGERGRGIEIANGLDSK